MIPAKTERSDDLYRDLDLWPMSDVVTTEFGVHIIKVTDRTPGEPSNFEKIKDDVKEICANEYYQQIITQQRAAAKIVYNP